jgi:hypothetical protein
MVQVCDSTALQAEVVAASDEAEALAAQHGFSDADAADILADLAAAQAAGAAPGATEPAPGLHQPQDAAATADAVPETDTVPQQLEGAAPQHDEPDHAMDGAADVGSNAAAADHVAAESLSAESAPAETAEAADAQPGELQPEPAPAEPDEPDLEPADQPDELHVATADPGVDAAGSNGDDTVAEMSAGDSPHPNEAWGMSLEGHCTICIYGQLCSLMLCSLVSE